MLNRVRELVAADQLQEAFDLLTEMHHPVISDALPLLKGRYESLNKLIIEDTLSPDEVIRNKNKLRASLLTLVDEVEGKGKSPTSSFLLVSKKPPQRILLLGLIAGTIVLLGVWWMTKGYPEKGNSDSSDVTIETHGENSPAVIGDDVEINYGGELRSEKEESDSLDQPNP
ncbi:MAG: hypothetical protein AAFR61_17065 [Bacteroidota bacterium]